MKTLLKNGFVVNVFTDKIEKKNVLICDGFIVGVGDYCDEDADYIKDVAGKFICPGFIDGHIHIESTMLTPKEFVKTCLPKGTTAVIADPHEIANVSGVKGIEYILEESDGLPLDIYVMIPSCVPATPFDETGAVLGAKDIIGLYNHPRVLGLGEMMNYPGVLFDDIEVLKKIEDAKNLGKVINGHAPLLSGKELDKYIAAGIGDDHECSDIDEAMERIEKGQMVMIRQGTAAKNLEALLPLFDEPYNRRCMLVTDDRHPADLIEDGHIDNIIRLAAKAGKNPVIAIRMATIQAAEYFGLKRVGAIAPGYVADLIILDELENVSVTDVYKNGELVVSKGKVKPFDEVKVSEEIKKAVKGSFKVNELSECDFYVEPKGKLCRVIQVLPKQLLTDEKIEALCFAKNNGIDINKDILKLAVIERHKNTGHKGIGYISGVGLKKGAIASSVSHDSHNLIVIGTNDRDMAIAANCIREMGGGNVVVADGEIVAKMPLAIAGLMGESSALEMAKQNEMVRNAVCKLGVNDDIEPFMNMAFISLPVIPSLKMTTKGLVDVNKQEIVPLFAD